MPSNRLSLRLAQLPHDVLAELAARLCSDSPALQAIAEECMAAHKPLSHELVERVLLSPDLVPSILGPLETEDRAAAAVCSQWLAGWKVTNEPPWPRRRLTQVPLDFPEELLLDGSDMSMAATPDGRLVVRAREELHILDRSMRVLQTLAGEYGGMIAASDDSIFHVRRHIILCRSSQDGTVQANYRLHGYSFHSLVLAPGGLLFCGMSKDDDGATRIFDGSDSDDNDDEDDPPDEIIALDAQTLQLRHRFGLGLGLNDAYRLDARQLTVVGDELFVCDASNDRLHVFSLTGEHRRSITGEWRSPQHLCFAKNRLYLVEGRSYGVHGRRILVLTLQGDILQIYKHPTKPRDSFGSAEGIDSICCFDSKLLASYCARGSHLAYGVLALQGV